MREGQAKQEQEFPFNVHIYSHSIAGKTINEARFYNWLVEGSTRGLTAHAGARRPIHGRGAGLRRSAQKSSALQ